MPSPRWLARLTIPMIVGAALITSAAIATADATNDAYLAQLRAAGFTWPPDHDEAIIGMAHLICELAARLDNVGLVEDGVYRVPFTQENLADACGLSVVHVNRTLQELRRGGLIKWQRRTVTLLKREELEEIAEFQPDYLHQGDGEAVSDLKR